MADQYLKESQTQSKGVEEEAQGCGIFDFLKKKDSEEKPHQEQEQHKHTTLAEKLHHHDGDSSSVSLVDLVIKKLNSQHNLYQ